jgi:hypothetical protein
MTSITITQARQMTRTIEQALEIGYGPAFAALPPAVQAFARRLEDAHAARFDQLMAEVDSPDWHARHAAEAQAAQAEMQARQQARRAARAARRADALSQAVRDLPRRCDPAQLASGLTWMQLRHFIAGGLDRELATALRAAGWHHLRRPVRSVFGVRERVWRQTPGRRGPRAQAQS